MELLKTFFTTYVRPHWAFWLVVVVLLFFVVWFSNPAQPVKPMGKKATARTEARMSQTQQQVAQDTARRAKATQAAAHAYKTGQSAETRALYLRSQTHSHAPTPPVTDTAAQRLQRFLTSY